MNLFSILQDFKLHVYIQTQQNINQHVVLFIYSQLHANTVWFWTECWPRTHGSTKLDHILLTGIFRCTVFTVVRYGRHVIWVRRVVFSNRCGRLCCSTGGGGRFGGSCTNYCDISTIYKTFLLFCTPSTPLSCLRIYPPVVSCINAKQNILLIIFVQL